MLVFEERGKPECPEKNLSEQRREPTTNSNHIWRRHRDWNPGHFGGRRALSPLRHPLLPIQPTEFCSWALGIRRFLGRSHTALVQLKDSQRISNRLDEEDREKRSKTALFRFPAFLWLYMAKETRRTQLKA